MFSLFRLAQLAAPEIEQAGGGAILAITSMAAENKNQRMAFYGSSKAATSHLVRNIAFDLGLRRIRVNAVAQVPPAPMRCNRCSPPKFKPVCSATRPSNAWASRRTWPCRPVFVFTRRQLDQWPNPHRLGRGRTRAGLKPVTKKPLQRLVISLLHPTTPRLGRTVCA